MIAWIFFVYLELFFLKLVQNLNHSYKAFEITAK